MRTINVITIFIFIQVFGFKPANAQCCSAGGSCPIAGGASQGVLLKNQVELNANYQYVSTNKFLNGDSEDKDFLDRYYSNYGYFRTAYGVTEDFTMSVEAGYYFNKTQIGLDNRDKISTSGWGDLIIFPRYDVFFKSDFEKKIEITVGAGIKIPLGNPNDTLGQVEPFSGMEYYILKPPAIRTTTGSNDFILYGFFYRGFPLKKFSVFSNVIYMKKGWNKLGERAGDYISVGLFANRTFFEKLGVTLQLKGELIERMETNEDLNLYGFFNYDPDATGSKKVLIAPQLSYSVKTMTIYINSEFPLYQYVNGQQIASQYFITSGISYKFMAKRAKEKSSGVIQE